MELRLGVSTLPLKMKKNFIYYLQLIWFISFHLIFTPVKYSCRLLFFYLFSYISLFMIS